MKTNELSCNGSRRNFTPYCLGLLIFVIVLIMPRCTLEEKTVEPSQLLTLKSAMMVYVWNVEPWTNTTLIGLRAMTNTDVITSLDVLLSSREGELSKAESHKPKLFSKYQKEIKELFSRLSFIGGESALFLTSRDKLPFNFVSVDNKICFMITGLYIPKIYNTLRTTSKTRAAKTLESYFLPTLKEIHSAFKQTDIEYHAIFGFYGSKDFLKDSVTENLESEALCLVVLKADCRRFHDGNITDNELLGRSQIFLKDRDMIGDCKKVEVKID